jgi:hypothetical protein
MKMFQVNTYMNGSYQQKRNKHTVISAKDIY